MRWGIENSFRELKYHVGLIAFHSKKKECVIQEIFARLIMYNFSMLITENLSADDDKQNTYRYKTNYAAAIYACLKFYRSDHANPSVLEELIIRSKCPVRPDRVAKRKTRYHSAVSFMKCYTDRAVDKHPKIWYNRTNQTRKGKSNEVQQRIQRRSVKTLR